MPGEDEQNLALWAQTTHGSAKLPWRAQWPPMSTFSSGSQGLGCRQPEELAAPGQEADYCVWEELNASISASTSASERHFWKQNHRKRKKP